MPEARADVGGNAEEPEDNQPRAPLAPAVGITHALYPVPQHLKPSLLLHC